MTEQQQVSEQMAKAVQELLKDTMQVTLNQIIKNNGVNLTAITGERDGLGTNVYVDHDIQMIMDGETTVEDVAARIAGVLQAQAEEAPFTSSGVREMFEHPETDRILLKVVNRDQNSEMLRTTPHRDIHGDLSAIASYRVSDEASAVITHSIAAQMGMTASEIIDHAIRNASNEEHTVQSMAEILAESMGMSPEEAKMMFGSDDSMIVVTNSDKRFGAGDIFVDKTLREQVAEKMGGDFYIIPSSIHEVICVRSDTMSPEQAATMIREVNANEVRPEEVLSNHPYLVNAETLKISNPCVEQAERVADTVRHSAHM